MLETGGGLRQREYPTATMNAATAVTATTSHGFGRRWPAGGELVRPSAAANSPALRNRSTGAFARARMTADSTLSGTVSRTVLSRVGRSVKSLAITACAVGPECGASPASISYSTAPKE